MCCPHPKLSGLQSKFGRGVSLVQSTPFSGFLVIVLFCFLSFVVAVVVALYHRWLIVVFPHIQQRGFAGNVVSLVNQCLCGSWHCQWQLS